MSFTLFFYSLVASTISLVLISASSIIFLLPLVLRNDEEIEKMCGTFFVGNPHMKKSLMQDRENAKLGIFLLSVGALFQITSIYLQMII